MTAATKPHRPTELACQATLIAAAKRGGWRVHAERTSRTNSGNYATAIAGHKGFPDLVLAHPQRGVLFIELKRSPNRMELPQIEWQDTLTAAGVTAQTWWVPEHLDEHTAWLINGGAA